MGLTFTHQTSSTVGGMSGFRRLLLVLIIILVSIHKGEAAPKAKTLLVETRGGKPGQINQGFPNVFSEIRDYHQCNNDYHNCNDYHACNDYHTCRDYYFCPADPTIICP